MPTGFDHLMNTPQTAIGKGTVGEPTPPPQGKEGIEIKLAMFFDGTMNNRSNTEARINKNKKITNGSKKDNILNETTKDFLSSYANFYSNVAILEYMNLRKEGAEHHVSVYVEGIGTVDYVEDATEKDRHGEDKLDKHGNKIKIADVDNSNDQMMGYALGSGPTGIVARVTKGFQKAKAKIKDAYVPDDQYIQKITIDVIGFSRGAAAARHFVARHAQRQSGLPGPWVGQGAPELEINFVGLFETVSSFFSLNDSTKWREGTGRKVGIFSTDVSELSLAMGAVPKRVVHLTAQNELRANFSLTTIDSSLEAGVGFEVALPGVHSDIGGGYVEPDPDNEAMDPTKSYPNEPGRPAIRALNRENRRMVNREEKRELVADGWYTDGTNGTPNQFMPVDWEAYARHRTWEDHRTNVARSNGQTYQQVPYSGAEYGSRYLTNQYQYVALYLMMGSANKNIGTGEHFQMEFESLNLEANKKYRVPADLLAVQNYFADYVDAHSGRTERLIAELPGDTMIKELRNKYLHRSSVILKESLKTITTYIAYRRNGNGKRKVFSDAHEVTPDYAVEVPDLSAEASNEPEVPAAIGTPAAGEVSN